MLGIDSINILLAFFTLLLSAIGCVVYGAINWTKETPISEDEDKAEREWQKEERAIDENLTGGAA